MKINPWAILPVIVIGIAIIPNVALVLASRDARPEPVSAQSWELTKRFDADRRGAAAFAAAGGRLAVAVAAGSATFTLDPGSEPLPGAPMLRLYCPAEAAADRTVAWADVGQPLRVELPRRGRWVARFDAGDQQALATVAFSAP
jgi:hypothetical protein